MDKLPSAPTEKQQSASLVLSSGCLFEFYYFCHTKGVNMIAFLCAAPKILLYNISQQQADVCVE